MGAMAGLLAVLLAPTFTRAGDPDARQVCAGNLKALYAATRAYAADHEGDLPPSVNPRTGGQVWLWWYDSLKPYTSDLRVFCCPASPKAEEYGVYDQEPLLPPAVFSPHMVTYGMNYLFAPAHNKRAPYRLATLENPGNVLLFAEAKSYLVSSNRGGWDVNPLHDGVLNACLADGAVIPARPEYRAGGAYVLRRVDNGKALAWSPDATAGR